MPEDRSLDDFAGTAAGADSADSDDDAVHPDDAEGDAAEAADPADADPADVDPAVATSTWHADGAECERCGERVERRWREADAFVCADCASW
ncbi:MAG: DUF7573 domain-containing protein [Methanobacteriota archaeon]